LDLAAKLHGQTNSGAHSIDIWMQDTSKGKQDASWKHFGELNAEDLFFLTNQQNTVICVAHR